MMHRPARGRIIVFGIMFGYPLVGIIYQYLHYLLGLRALGWDVYYIEDSARWIYNIKLGDLSPDATDNVSTVVAVLERFGFGERWAFRGAYPGGACYGMDEARLLKLYAEVDAFLNVTGAQEIRAEHMVCPRRIYIESDPFSSQVKLANGDPHMTALLAAHDTHFTFAENIGAADCGIPLGPYEWLPTRQPVALELWSGTSVAGGDAYTTITTWQNRDKHVVYRGETYYWTKDREFEPYLDLPQHRPAAHFEIAAIVPNDVQAMLIANGWAHVDPAGFAGDIDSYRAYIDCSRAEFTVARDQYVRPNTGWFSDRSACYLAASRPVITQHTGFAKTLPTGQGLFGFSSMQNVLDAVDRIESDYVGNCRAARAIAAEYFAGEKVIGSLLARAGLS